MRCADLRAWRTICFNPVQCRRTPDEHEEERKMASIHHEQSVNVGVDEAWTALRQVGDAHRLFAPVLAAGRLDGDTRTVTFANGMVVRERMLVVDETHRRVSYTALEAAGMTFHHASMQVIDDGPGRCRFVWITDFLPADVESALAPLIEQGGAALKANLEGRAHLAPALGASQRDAGRDSPASR
jgi:hypothetical protein